MSTQRVHINTRAQLIDLNNDLTNFKLSFECVSIPIDAEYKLHVATQTELDVTDIGSLPFKTVRGRMTGNIIADENKYENYFLIVFAEKDMDLDVKIDIIPIEPKSTDSGTSGNSSEQKLKSLSTVFGTGYWTASNIFFWVAFMVIVSFLIYYLFIRRKNDVTDSSNEKTSSMPFHSVIDDINDL